jgi:hypothetical protein
LPPEMIFSRSHRNTKRRDAIKAESESLRARLMPSGGKRCPNITGLRHKAARIEFIKRREHIDLLTNLVDWGQQEFVSRSTHSSRVHLKPRNQKTHSNWEDFHYHVGEVHQVLSKPRL